MLIKIKKISEKAVIPKYAKKGDAGLDLFAATKILTDDYLEYGTGLIFEIPPGFVGLVFPRSSVSKTNLALANSVGVLDSGYRGELKLRFFQKNNKKENEYQIGDKIGQLIIVAYPDIEIKEADDLSKTERSDGGFGSTGK